MPTVLLINGFRFFFYVNDHTPMHIHVERGEGTAKFLLEPVMLIKSKRFKAAELSEIRNLVNDNLVFLKEKWNEYFNNKQV